MDSQKMQQAMKVHKSALCEKTKEFMLFVLAQLTSLDVINHDKLSANATKGGVVKLKAWHENETIFYEMVIRDGKRDGNFTMWNPKGDQICVIPFENGEIHGTAHLYKAGGEEIVVFEHDSPIVVDR